LGKDVELYLIRAPDIAELLHGAEARLFHALFQLES
jgi:hypothetical protein